MPGNITVTTSQHGRNAEDGSLCLEELDLASSGAPSVAVRWLGQAGFLFRFGNRRLIIDPYLSDSLAEKYRDAKFKHERMMPVPVAPSELRNIDWVFATHRHTDHLDIGTLPHLAHANPGCRFLVPAAAGKHLRDFIGIDPRSTVLLDVGDRIELAADATVEVVASAHEELQYDAHGHAVFLGYVFTLRGIKIYHSGDCIPYAGLAETLAALGIDVALLPVNGRDAFRRANGVPGNFTFAEAADLCRAAGIAKLIPHHFGMFAFNTVDPDSLRTPQLGVNVTIPDVDHTLLLGRRS